MQAIARLTTLSPHAVSNILLGEETEILKVDENGIPEAYVDVDFHIEKVKPLPLLSSIFDEVKGQA